MKLLFICNQGENRSRTAKELFSNKFETKSAGIYACEKENELTKEALEWADIVFVMEEHQREFIAENYTKQYLMKRVLNLEVPDIYRYNQPELIKILKNNVNKWFKRIN